MKNIISITKQHVLNNKRHISTNLIYAFMLSGNGGENKFDMEDLNPKHFLFILTLFNPDGMSQKNKDKYRTEFYKLFDLNYDKVKEESGYTFGYFFNEIKSFSKEKIDVLNILIQKWKLEVEI